MDFSCEQGSNVRVHDGTGNARNSGGEEVDVLIFGCLVFCFCMVILVPHTLIPHTHTQRHAAAIRGSTGFS